MNFFVKQFNQLETFELYEIFKARFQVFVMEQRCFYLDMDDIDYNSFHIFSLNGRIVNSYARLFQEETPKVWHVGRVLTINRGQGVGKSIMKKVIDVALNNNAKELRLDAQIQALGFYEKLGFTTCSEEFVEAGIPHIMMKMSF